MKFQGLVKTVGNFIMKNSPTILTIMGCSGVVGTAIMASRATAVSTADYISKNEPMTTKELIKEYWQNYIPPAIMGGASIACIIGANTISTKRQLALASAYTLAETSLKEYQEEVKELIGEKKHEKIEDNIAKKHLETKSVPSEDQVIVTGTGDTLCYDDYTGRYFESSVEKIKRAENELNKRLMSEMFISLNELYYAIGLPSVPVGNEMGWNIDEEGLIDITYSAQIVDYKDKETPCIVIRYIVGPRFNVYGDKY